MDSNALSKLGVAPAYEAELNLPVVVAREKVSSWSVTNLYSDSDEGFMVL